MLLRGVLDRSERRFGAGRGVSRAYFVSVLLVGFFLIMNLFVSILLEAFAGDEEEQEGGGGGEEEKKEEAPAEPATVAAPFFAPPLERVAPAASGEVPF